MGAVKTTVPTTPATPAAETPLVRELGEHVSFHASIETDKVKDLGDGMLEAIITSSIVDHQGEAINMDGVDTTNYHGTVLYGHDYEGLPIGKTVNMTKFKNKMKARFQLATDIYPFAKTIYDMIKGGYLTDVSIGGLVSKWSEDYRTVEGLVMKEFSVVPIGANPDAIITAKSLGKSLPQLKSEYTDFVRQSMVDKVADLGDDEVSQAIKTLKSLVATLEDAASAHSKQADGESRKVKRIVLIDTAKAVVRQSDTVRRTVKLKTYEEHANERHQNHRRRVSLGGTRAKAN